MLPLPAQGHLNQFLQLSHLISSYKIQVHYKWSAVHNRQVKLRAHGLNPMDNTKIHFLDFSMPPFVSPPPNPNSSNKCSAHLQPSIEASMHLRQPVSALSPTTKRMIIIHDPLIASVVWDATSIPNAEAYGFHCALLFPFSPTCGKPWENLSHQQQKYPTSFHPCFTFEIMNFSAHQYEFAKTAVGDLYNTCR